VILTKDYEASKQVRRRAIDYVRRSVMRGSPLAPGVLFAQGRRDGWTRTPLHRAVWNLIDRGEVSLTRDRCLTPGVS
jgi:hypothetical protein